MTTFILPEAEPRMKPPIITFSPLRTNPRVLMLARAESET